MSELINISNRRTIQWQLLSSVSALALLTSAAGEAIADSDAASRPVVWIELGGELERMSGQGDNFPVPFVAANPTSSVLHSTSPFQAQNPPAFSFAGEGKISFQPEALDWGFAVSVNYGRSGNSKEVDHQTNRLFYVSYSYDGAPKYHENPRGIDKFSDTLSRHDESHTILDFSIGKDVGLGFLGKNVSSVFNFGVRFAQFASETSFSARARPEVQFKYAQEPSLQAKFQFPYYHTYHSTGHASRSFNGIGPAISWNASAPLIGNPQDSEITLDWSANVALLFGRQRASVQHQASGHYVTWQFALNGQRFTAYPAVPGGHISDRSVTVPDVGGTFGVSYRYSNAKISFGYRADLFVGAIDGGIDARKSETLGFYGPFATISLGLGG